MSSLFIHSFVLIVLSQSWLCFAARCLVICAQMFVKLVLHKVESCF